MDVSKIKYLLLLAALAAGIQLWTAQTQFDPKSAPSPKGAMVSDPLCPHTQAATVREVADGVYVRFGVQALMTAQNHGGIANTGFVIGEKSIAVVDTGGSYCDGAALLAAIKRISQKPINYIINTHVHPDHIFGNWAFKGQGGQFIGHVKLPRAMAERGPHYLTNFERLMGKEALQGTILVPSTKGVGIDKPLKLDLGDRKIELRSFAISHTNQDLVVLDLKTKTIFTGDLLFRGHLPVIDGSFKGWRKTMDDLSQIKVAHVIPGHGPEAKDWAKGFKDQNRYFVQLRQDIQKDLDAGVDLLQTQKTAGEAEKSKWDLFDEFNKRNVANAYSEMEWD